MKSIRRVLRAMRPYRAQVILNWICMAFLVAADLGIPRMLQRIIDQGIKAGNSALILQSSLIMVGLILVSAGATVGITVFAVRVSQSVGADLREALFSRVLSLSARNLDRWRTGQLITRSSSDVQQVTQFVFFTGRMFLRVPLVAVGAVTMMVLTDWRLALIMLFILPAATLIFLWYAGRAQPMFMDVQRKLDRLNAIFQENLSGVRVVKAFVRARHEKDRFEQINADLTTRSVRVGRFLAILMPSLHYLVNIGIVLVVGLGGFLAVRAELSVGQIIAFNSYLLWILMVLSHLGAMVSFISASDASAQRIYEVLDEAPAIADGAGASPLIDSEGHVALRDVGFAYNSHEHEPVLQDVNLTVKPGETVAILGTTGSGKSSLINLVPRYYDVALGEVAVDGRDVRTLTLESLRRAIGLVPQDTVLFTGTIRDNIRFGRPDADDAQVIAAAKAAQVHNFIMGLPEGYDSTVGQRGVNLSGGQRQRLAVARALLVQPRVLILDDSTSAVDVETEVALQEALASFGKGRSTILVAQRISSVLGADKIVVLERGRIAAAGTHRELMASCPTYREIYDSQLGDSTGTGETV
ncbi:MAG: ABC transporter ATP-binding protein [Phycisphaerae bacterium]|nr:ABC transporter ATP-binding protein [Phycisphaerae bacterium]